MLLPLFGIIVIKIQDEVHELLHCRDLYMIFIEPDGATKMQVHFNLVVILESDVRHLLLIKVTIKKALLVEVTPQI